MRKLLLLTIATMLMILGVNSTLLAQTPAVFCGELSIFDCSILHDSADTMAKLESGGLDFDLTLRLTDLPDAPETLDFRLNGSGTYTLDLTRLNAVSTSPDDLLNELPQIVEDVLQSISADATLILHIPDMPGSESLPSKVSFDARMVGGFIYVKLDKLAALDTSGMLPRGWIGLDLAGFYRAALEQQGSLQGMPSVSPSNVFTDPAFQASYMSIEREKDTMVNGQQAAVFMTSINLGEIFAIPAYRDDLREAVEPQIESLDLPSYISIDDLLDAYAELFRQFNIVSFQKIGLEDKLVYDYQLLIGWYPDLNAFDRALGGTGSSLPSFGMRLWLEAKLNQFNAVPPISVPKNAIIIPLNSIVPVRPSM